MINICGTFSGLYVAASYSSSVDKELDLSTANHSESFTHIPQETPLLESSESRTLYPSVSSLPSQIIPLISTISSVELIDVSESLSDSISPSSVTELLSLLSSTNLSELSEDFVKNINKESTYLSESYPTDALPSSFTQHTAREELLHTSYSMHDSLQENISPSTPETTTNSITHFHTPLMSLLVAPSSYYWQAESTLTSSIYNSSAQSLTTSSSDNELPNPNLLPVPTDLDHKKLLMLVLRAEDCSKFSKLDFEKMLEKLMAKFDFNDVIPEISNAKCYSHLNINVTVGGPTPTLRFLPNMDSKNNFTVDVLNRTFRIVKFEKVDLKLEKSKSSNSSSSIITAVAKHESVAYIVVGVCFGLILVICISVCCIKCCCLRKPPKRCSVPNKGTHVRLRPEDYTLTPIPRPTSLYVDYYRGSVTADIYSTTSAGSIVSTTPTVEQGVVQPFDTSIVPLEDSSNLPLDSSRDPSVESVPVQSDLKTFNIHSLSGKGFRTVSTDSKEQLNPKAHSRKVEIKPSGVANPTFQRY